MKPTFKSTKAELLAYIESQDETEVKETARRLSDTIETPKKDKDIAKTLLDAIPIFTGEEGQMKLESFILRLDDYIEYTGIGDTQMRFLVKAKLTNTAIIWYKSCKEDITWKEFKKALRNRFTDRDSVRMNLAKLSAITYTGDPSDYVKRFRELLELIGTRNFEDNLMSFLKPLPEGIAKSLWSSEQNLKDMEELYKGLLRNTMYDAINVQTEAHLVKSDSKFVKKKCTHCGMTNHVVSQCRRLKQQKSNYAFGGTVNALEQEPEKDEAIALMSYTED
jgi:Ty3 transposon capsid-like protein